MTQQTHSPPAISEEVSAERRFRLPGGKVLRDGRRLYWWAELVAILAFYGVYSTIRNSTEGGTAAARSHALDIIRWQRDLGIYHEETLQDWALHFKPLVVFMNYFYGSLHFVVTAGVGIWLFRRFRDHYPLWRNTLGIATGMALIGFALWPLMPPRLLPDGFGFVDTLARYPTFWSFNSKTMSNISNQYAAMPSVHCVWALWCACVVVPRARGTWAKVLFALYPLLTVTAIVLTGNHYFLDAVGGFVVLGVGYLLARRFTRAGRGEPRPDLGGVTAPA